MKPVRQTKRGGPNVPPEERGDCWNACLASARPRRAPPGSIAHSDDPEHHWWDETQDALAPHGYEVVLTSWNTYPSGYWIAAVPSKNLGTHDDGRPVMHVIVMHGGQVAHDPCLGERYPMGTAIDDLDLDGAYVLVPLQVRSLAA